MEKNEEKRLPNYRVRFVILAVCFALVFFASFLLGRYLVSPGEIATVLAEKFLEIFTHGRPVLAKSWSSASETVAMLRLPRITAGALIGAALSAAGAAYQGMFRNPMVSPDILGASSGAAFGAALCILLGFGYMGVTAGAFLFGICAVAAAYLISRAGRTDSTLAMVLAGMVISSLFTAGTSFIKLIADTEETLPAITYWLMGSLSSIKGRDALLVSVPIIIGLVPLFLLRWRMNLLTVGDEEAKSMGVNTMSLRLVVIVCATLLTAASVSVSGLIGWIGLVIPHFSRMLFGSDYRRVMPASALMGATFLMVVDNIARLSFTSEIPIGILTAFVGAPVFVTLIVRGGVRREY